MILLCAVCILAEEVLSVSATPGRRSILSDEGGESDSKEIRTGISTPRYRIRIISIKDKTYKNRWGSTVPNSV